MLDRLCIGVDGSDCARRATAVGIAIAEAAGASVDVVHAMSEDPESGEPVDGDRVLTELAGPIDDVGVDIQGHALTGQPAETVVRFADDRDADLLVLGRRGLGGVRDRLLGSVVHAVLRGTERPVLCVPEGEGSFEVSDLLAPTDGSTAAERAAPIAATLAHQHDATIHTCHVLDLARVAGPFNAGGVTPQTIEHYEERGRTFLDRMAQRLHEHHPGLDIRSAVVRDAAHAGLAKYAADHEIDLIVLSSRGSTSGLGQMLGSVADRVLRTVEVPVLVVTGDPTEEGSSAR